MSNLPQSSETISQPLVSKPENELYKGTDFKGNPITFNEKQTEFIKLVLEGKSCILLGAAGTGKTSVMQGVIAALIQGGRIGLLQAEDHKFLKTNTPAMVVTAFTRRAVSNIRRVMNHGMKDNCITVHKLLEYEPVYYEEYDEVSGKEKKTMAFEPTRNTLRVLPHLDVIAVEESSMLSTELYTLVETATQNNAQYIFLGDIQQLPPVFGAAILGYKMLQLPTVELTEVYRQALESPIIRLAHRILSGKPIPASEYPEWYVEGKLKIHPWKKKLHADVALMTAAHFFKAAYDSGSYNPEEDMILCPFNKSFGTIELNKYIAQHIAQKQGRVVYEVIAGYEKVYLSVGDKVLYDKEDAEIVSIKPNSVYLGKKPQAASKTLDYWGHEHSHTLPSLTGSIEDAEEELSRIEFLLEAAAASSDKDERVRVASHEVTVKILDSGEEVKITAAGDINILLLSYSLTVHKSQGSEWRRVFLVLHQSHATMLQRELLYTAVTRAREELYVICEPETFTTGIVNQRIKGNSLQEKAEYFKGRLELVNNKDS